MAGKNIYEIFACKDKEQLYEKIFSQSNDVSELIDFIDYAKNDIALTNREFRDELDVINYVDTLRKPSPSKVYVIGTNTVNQPIMLTSFNPKDEKSFQKCMRDLIEAVTVNAVIFYNDSARHFIEGQVRNNLESIGINIIDEVTCRGKYYFMNSGHLGERDFKKSSLDNKVQAPGIDFSLNEKYSEFIKYYADKNILGKNIIADKERIKVELKLGFQHERREEFGCILFDKNNNIIDLSVLFNGTVNKLMVDPLVLYRHVLAHSNAKGFLVFHNHPSGNPSPSVEDIKLTERLLKTSKILGLECQDHFVVSKKEVHSFRENNLIFNNASTQKNTEARNIELQVGESNFNYVAINGKRKAIICESLSAISYINKRFIDFIENNKPLPFLPNERGECNTRAVHDANGYEFRGIQQLACKVYLYERGVPNDNVCTWRQAMKNHTVIKAGERGFLVPSFDKKTNKQKVLRYFAQSQTNKKENFYVPFKASKNIMPFEQKSSDIKNYIENYLQCVHEHRPFIVCDDVAKEFKIKLVNEIKNDSLALFKLCSINKAHRLSEAEKTQRVSFER